MKRGVEQKKETPKPVQQGRWAWLEPFMHDWGRLVIPVGVAAVLAALYYGGVLDDTSVGLVIGLLVLAGIFTAAVLVVWRNEFPRWVRTTMVVLGVVYVGGFILPFVRTVYPGTAAFSTTVSRDSDVAVGDGVDGGYFGVEVYAKAMAESEGMRGGEGQYKMQIKSGGGSDEIAGKFSDVMRSVRAGRRGTRQVEQKHLMEVHTLHLADGPKMLKVARLDQAIGPELRVSFYPILIPPPVLWVLAGLAVLLAVVLDGLFQLQTERWRLAPWMAMAASYLLIFGSTYERGSVMNTAIWSTVFGGVVGFLGGYLLSWVGRKIIGKARTRVT